MILPDNVILLDSLGDIKPDNACPVLVCASHCGDNGTFACKLKSCGVQAVILNNAGIGKNQAGISGLPYYAAEGILACAVDCFSAEIGIAADTWASGIISHTNSLAKEAGIRVGDSVQNAVAKILPVINQLTSIQNATTVEPSNVNKNHQKLFKIEIAGKTITVADSITFLTEENKGDVLVCGSHGGVSAGHYAQKHQLKAVFFNDAGIGKNNAGIQSLGSLSEIGIPACTVDCMSAEIFNGHDMLENGIISVCNQLAKNRNINEKMTIKEAIKYI